MAAGDNRNRLRKEPSFAALCGASPLDASSGQQQRHRLNRAAIARRTVPCSRIVLWRLGWDHTTKATLARRVAEGKTKREDHPLPQALRGDGGLRRRQSHFGYQLPGSPAASAGASSHSFVSLDRSWATDTTRVTRSRACTRFGYHTSSKALLVDVRSAIPGSESDAPPPVGRASFAS